MSKEDEIKKLSEQLLKLLSAPDEPEQKVPAQESQTHQINEKENKDVVEILHKLERLNVEPTVVRQIMRRVDEVYGKAENYKFTKPLYEETGKLSKYDDI